MRLLQLFTNFFFGGGAPCMCPYNADTTQPSAAIYQPTNQTLSLVLTFNNNNKLLSQKQQTENNKTSKPINSQKQISLCNSTQFFYINFDNFIQMAHLATFLRLLLLKCKTPHFSIPHTFFPEFRTTGYYNLTRLQCASSQDTDLSCRVPISTFCRTRLLQSTNVTNRRTSRVTLVEQVLHAIIRCSKNGSYFSFLLNYLASFS